MKIVKIILYLTLGLFFISNFCDAQEISTLVNYFPNTINTFVKDYFPNRVYNQSGGSTQLRGMSITVLNDCFLTEVDVSDNPIVNATRIRIYTSTDNIVGVFATSSLISNYKANFGNFQLSSSSIYFITADGQGNSYNYRYEGLGYLPLPLVTTNIKYNFTVYRTYSVSTAPLTFSTSSYATNLALIITNVKLIDMASSTEALWYLGDNIFGILIGIGVVVVLITFYSLMRILTHLKQ